MKNISIVGIIAGFCLIIVSFFVSVPDRTIIDPKKYIGGDAYNYQIEATIRAGEIAGAKTAKAIYLVGGFILLFGSFIAFGTITEPKKIEANKDLIKKNLDNDAGNKEYNSENYDEYIKKELTKNNGLAEQQKKCHHCGSNVGKSLALCPVCNYKMS